MTYLRPSRRRGRNDARRLKIAAVALGIVALVVLNAYPPLFLQRLFMPLAEPFWAFHDRASAAATAVYAFFTDKTALTDEINNLSAENETLRVQLSIANEAAAENQALLKLGGRDPKQAYVTAAVLSRPPITAYDTLLIDAGTVEGVTQGSLVTADGGVVIGDIAEVSAHGATVSLLSSPGRETNVLIGTNKIPVPARGNGGGNFEARVPKDQPVAVGDPVVAPGINPLMFGVVGAVTTEPSDPFSLVDFTLPINQNTIRFVSVLK